jgi:hypothetical protein
MPPGTTAHKTPTGGNDPTYAELIPPIASLIAEKHPDALDVEEDADIFSEILKSRKPEDNAEDRVFQSSTELLRFRLRSTGRYLSETMNEYGILVKQEVCNLDGKIRRPTESHDLERWTFKVAQELQTHKEDFLKSQGVTHADLIEIKKVKDAQIIKIAFMSGQWFGKILGGAAFSLNADWVYENFFAPNEGHAEGKEWALKNNWFRQTIVRASPKFVDIPPGSACSKEKVDALSVQIESGFPLKFIQLTLKGTVRDWVGSSDQCALNSVTSALTVFGDDPGTVYLHASADDIQRSTRRLKEIKKLLNQKTAFYACTFLPEGRNLESMLALLVSCPKHMFLAQLVCGDGGTEHCVTFYAGHIFDTCGQYTTSLALTFKNLNSLCGWTCTPTRTTATCHAA